MTRKITPQHISDRRVSELLKDFFFYISFYINPEIFFSFIMANSWHAYFDETDVEDWDVLQFHTEWIQRNPVNLAYDKSSDTLAKSLRAIVNKCSDDKKVTKAKSLLADIKVNYF